MTLDQGLDKAHSELNEDWRELNTTITALINLIDPNREKILITFSGFGLTVIEHKQSGSTLLITRISSAIEDVTYFINNDPAQNFTEEMVPNENVGSNTH